MTTTTSNYWTATAAATSPYVLLAASEDKNQHEPGTKLSSEERMKKSDEHKYGLCCSCDQGLDDRADFVCDTHVDGRFALMCNACNEYYSLVRHY